MTHLFELEDVSRFLSAYSLYGGDEQGQECVEAYVTNYLRGAATYDLSRKLTPP